MPNMKDRVGEEFGNLTISRFVGGENYAYKWECTCKCGATVVVRYSNLRSGKTTSCGCKKAESLRQQQTTHGMSDTQEYWIWRGIIKRCTDPNDKGWEHYGQRGIQICDRWLGDNGFQNFMQDLGPRPEAATVERRDNEGNYTPENCYWASRTTQARNTRRNRNIQFQGRTQCIAAWAAERSIPASRIYQRLNAGWSVADALSN